MKKCLKLSYSFFLIDMFFLIQGAADSATKLEYVKYKEVSKRETCNGKLHSMTCDGTKVQRYPAVAHVSIKAEYLTDCYFQRVMVVWKIEYRKGGKTEVAETKNNHLSYTLKHYSFNAPSLHYKVTASLTSRLSDDTIIEEDVTGVTCIIQFVHQNPAAHITGGSLKVVKPKTEIMISGTWSRNYDYSPEHKDRYLKYDWDCSKTPPEPCHQVGLYKNAYLKIDSQFVNLNDEFKVTLRVFSEQSGKISSDTQTIRVLDLPVEAEIKCLKNCYPVSGAVKVDQTICLTANCLSSCEGITNSDYEWELLGDIDIDYEADTEFGKNNRDFFIKPNVLSGKKNYDIKLYAKGNFVGMISFKVIAPIYVKGCQTVPLKGIAGKTTFNIRCRSQSHGDIINPEIFAVNEKDGTETLLASGFVVSVKLPLNSKIYLRVQDNHFQSAMTEINVELTDPLPEIPSLELLNKTVEESIQIINKYIRGSMHDSLIQEIANIMIQLQKDMSPKTESIRRRFQEAVLKNLAEGLNIGTLDFASQASAVVRDILRLDPDDIDTDMAESATNLCKMIAKKQLEYVENDYHHLDLAFETERSTKNLMECVEASNGYTDKKPLVADHELNITGIQSPAGEDESMTEDYPDYADETAAHKMEKLEVISKNYIEICASSGKTISQTMIPGEKQIENKGNVTAVAICKQHGYNFINRRLVSQDVTVIPSKDFADASDWVAGVLCTSRFDPFWWNQQHIKVSTVNVALLKFFVGRKEITEFEDPFHVYFKFREDTYSILSVITAETPYLGAYNAFDKMIAVASENGISVHRIDLAAGSRFVVFFHNLTIHDSFDVIVTDFARPVLEDFDKKTVITQEHPSLSHINENHYDIWSYLGILPSDKMLDSVGSANKIFTFSFSVFAATCNHWDVNQSLWTSSCQVGKDSNATHLHCICNSLSGFSGTVHYNPVRVDKVLTLDFTMEVQSCYIIQITCFVVLAFYCIILAFNAGSRRTVVKNVYFLSDIIFYDRYMYLLIVRTGHKIFSGTTSNVMVRLTGARGQSREHVLNFPDPAYNFLKKGNEDWFILATEEHLGHLIKIELWFDHIGARPTWWYCSEVFVYDFQSYKYWSFPVHSWFKINTKPNTHMEIYSSEYKEKKEKCKFLMRIVGLFSLSNTWRIFTGFADDRFQYVARFTFMLSIVMTIFAINFLYYKVPRLEADAAFGYDVELELQVGVFIIIFISPSCAYILHTALLYLFRHSENQLEDTGHKFSFMVRRICWIILSLNIACSLIFLIIFGFAMTKLPSLLWLLTVIGGLIFYILILENIAFSFISNTLQEAITFIYAKAKNIVDQVEAQRAKLYAKFGGKLLRPQCEHLYKKLDSYEIKEKQLNVSAKDIIKKNIRDLIMFSMYMIVLYLVTLVTKSDHSVLNHKLMTNLLKGTVTHTTSHEEILSLDDFVSYVEDTLLKIIHSATWYEEFAITEPGLMVDVSNKFLGVLHFRQQRTIPDSCQVPHKMLFLDVSCIPEHSQVEDQSSYGKNWQKDVTADDRYTDIWKYTPSESWSVTGKFSSYPPYGYILPLGRTLRNSMVSFYHMKNTTWLDNATRAIMVEFVTFGGSSNLFTSMLLLVEFSATGYCYSTHFVDTIRIFLDEEDLSITRFLLFTTFFVILFVFSVKTLFLVIKDKRQFFVDGWRYIDLLIIIISSICIFLFIHRTKTLIAFMQHLQHAKNNEFLDYFDVFFAESFMMCFTGCLIFIATLRFWKLLRFQTMFRMMEKTLFMSANEIISLVLCYFAMVSGYSVLFTVFFGSGNEYFQRFAESSLTLSMVTIQVLKAVDAKTLENSPYNVGYISYSFYLIGSLFFKSLLVSIVIYNYQRAQLYFSNETDRYDVEEFLRDEFQYYSSLFKIRMKKIRLRSGGENDISNVTPKADEHRYAGLISVSESRISGMESVIRCLLRERKKTLISSYEKKIILTTLYHQFGKPKEESREFFFKAFQDGKCKLVSDKRIELMAAITELLVSRFSEKEEKSVTMKHLRNKRKLENINARLDAHLDILNSFTFGYY